MTEVAKPTKAQRELLAWMVAYEEGDNGSLVRMRDDGHEWRGGDLIEYYRQRRIREILGEDPGPVDRLLADNVRGGYANHGWRRAGGTALANLEKRGFVQRVGFNWGTPLYVLTDEGRQAAST